MALWTPAQTKTALWLKANDEATLVRNSNGGVTQWQDKSTNARHATPNAPVPTDTAGLAKQALYFDELRQFAVPHHPDFSSAEGISVIGVVRYNSLTTNKGWIGKWWGSTSPENDWIHPLSTLGDQRAVVIREDQDQVRAGHPPSLQPHVWGMIVDPGTALTNFKDGVAVSTPLDKAKGSTSGALGIGSYIPHGPTSVNFRGWIGEVCIIPGAATVLLWEMLEGYLAHEWEIADQLQPDHPYRWIAPGAIPVSGRAIDSMGRKAERGIVFDWNNPKRYVRLDIGPQGEWETGATPGLPFGVYYHSLYDLFAPTVHGPYLVE